MTEKVSAGSPWMGPSSPLRSQQFVNNMIEVVDGHQQRKRLGQGLPPGVFHPRDSGMLKVKNITGDDLPAGAVVQLDDYLLNSDNRFADNESLWIEGNEPADPGAAERYAILLGPLPDTKIGWAFVSGCCIARISVNATTDKYATPVDGSTDLESATSGPIEILSPLGGTGSQQAYVRLNGPPPDKFWFHVKIAQGGLTANSPLALTTTDGTDFTSDAWPLYWDSGTPAFVFVGPAGCYRWEAHLLVETDWTQPTDAQHWWADVVFGGYVDGSSSPTNTFSSVQFTWPASQTGAASAGTAHTHDFIAVGATRRMNCSMSGIFYKLNDTPYVFELRAVSISTPTSGPALADFDVSGSLDMHIIDGV